MFVNHHVHTLSDIKKYYSYIIYIFKDFYEINWIFQRCVQNQKIDKLSIGVLNKCFNCAPKMLWEKRAQAANVLKVFSSQL